MIFSMEVETPMTLFLLGMLLGTILGIFFSALYCKGQYRELMDLLPGIIFENKILIQSILTTFPKQEKGIQILLKNTKYRVFKEHGEIKYVELT